MKRRKSKCRYEARKTILENYASGLSRYRGVIRDSYPEGICENYDARLEKI